MMEEKIGQYLYDTKWYCCRCGRKFEDTSDWEEIVNNSPDCRICNIPMVIIDLKKIIP